MSRRLGLIIGTNQYQDSAFRPLQYAENDARAFAQWLVNTRGGQWKPTDVQHLQGAHVTKQLVESLISQMCLNLTEPGDLVLIYFAGHVFLDERSGEGYLALADTRYQIAATGLHLNALVQHIWQRSSATQIVLILDSFQTGRRWNSMRATPYDSKPLLGPTTLNLLQQQNNRLLLCSCRGNEMAAEIGEQGLGSFMYRMIVGLSGQTGNISLRQLHGLLFSTLREQQRPQLFGRDQPPILLVGEHSVPNTGSLQYAPVGSAAMHAQADPYTENIRFSTGSWQSQKPGTGQLKANTGKQQAMVDQHRQQQCQAMLEQAKQKLQMQQLQEAYEITDQVLHIVPNFIPALTLKGQILGSSGNHQESLAVIEQLLQLDLNSAIAWSMKAVVLSNIGQHQPALVAIERSLELDVSNPETHSIKNNIMANLAAIQSQHLSNDRAPSDLLPPLEQPQGGAHTFFATLGLQLLGFLIGIAGTLQPILLTRLPGLVSVMLMTLGLLILTANAARAAHRYGFLHVLPTCLMSIIAAGTLAGSYMIGYRRIINFLTDPQHPEQSMLLAPIIFLGIWLISATAIPFIAALGGLISGAIVRTRRC